MLLNRLAAGPAMVGELAEPIDMTRVAVSKHLRVLENARLISRTIDGRVHRCALRPEVLQEVERWLAGYREFWTEKLTMRWRASRKMVAGTRRKRRGRP
jgi:DNA-binding transcriptional ArsR family regulator